LKNGNAFIGASVHSAVTPRGSPICFYLLTSSHRNFFLKKTHRSTANLLLRLATHPAPRLHCASCPSSLYYASLSGARSRSSSSPSRLSLHQSDLLRSSPLERRAQRHRDAVAGRRGVQLPSPSRAAASPPRCGAAVVGRCLQAPLCHYLRHADESPFSQVARRYCVESTCCKCMF
jgi:hypothetical protein